MKRDGYCHSLWQDTTDSNLTDSILPGSDEVFDVVIAGGGITGISTALQLQRAGKKVLVAEARSIGFGTTGGTTAHLNTFMDTTYDIVKDKFGKEDAIVLARTVQEALDLIRSNVITYGIDCSLQTLPAFVFAENEKQEKELDSLLDSCVECGVHAVYSNTIPVPVSFTRAIRLDGQSSFHPTRYLEGLAREFTAKGGIIIENCRVTDLKEGDIHKVHTSKGMFQAYHFIYATHIPPGVNLLHFRCAPYRSYAIACKLSEMSSYPDALVYDLQDPYHYYRTQEIDGEKYFIAGGEDHKTGHEENTQYCFTSLEADVRADFHVSEVVNKWSSQYFEPADGLPYIGPLPGHSERVYAATGFGGNGMIYSAVSAAVLTSIITEKEHPGIKLLDPARIKPMAGFSNFVKEAADVVGLLFNKLLPKDKIKELVELAPGEARLAKYEGQLLALYKDDAGEVHSLSAACTHIKCEVAWNTAEKSWDCPCHGSRFHYTGEMLTGPARKDLEKIELDN